MVPTPSAAGSSVGLVCADGDHDHRQPCLERSHDGPELAMINHQIAVRQEQAVSLIDKDLGQEGEITGGGPLLLIRTVGLVHRQRLMVNVRRASRVDSPSRHIGRNPSC